MGMSLNVKGSQENVACVTSSSLFSLGIFLWGQYKQQVSGCERGQDPDRGCLPPHWPLSLAWHQPAGSWLLVFLGSCAMCCEGKLLHTACLVLG